jgi:hypothetical protein
MIYKGNKTIELTGVPNFDSTCQGQPCITKTNSAAIKHVAKYTSGSDGPTIIPLNPEVPCDLGSFKTTDNVDYTKDADYSSIYNFPSHDQTSSDPPGDISAIYAGVKAYRRENECYDETYGGGYGYCSVVSCHAI